MLFFFFLNFNPLRRVRAYFLIPVSVSHTIYSFYIRETKAKSDIIQVLWPQSPITA